MIKLGDVVARLAPLPSGAERLVLANTAAGKVREVYPKGLARTAAITFTDETAMFRFLSYSIVEGGQYKYPARIANNLFQGSPETNSSNQIRLSPIMVDGSVQTIELVVDQVTPITNLPSKVFISTTADLTRKTEFIYGSDGSSVVTTLNGTTVFQKTVTHPIANSAKITLVRIKSLILVYVNDAFIYSAEHASIQPVLPDQVLWGLGVANNAGTISTSVKSLSTEAATGIAATPYGRMDCTRVTLGQAQWTRIASVLTDVAGPTFIDMIDCKWETDGAADRAFSCDVPGKAGASSLGANGGTKTFTWNLPANARVDLYAYSNQGYNPHKTIKSGVLQVRKFVS